jgi:hypothetical protein
MGNPFSGTPNPSKFKNEIRVDPGSGILYKAVKSGDYSFWDPLPEDQQIYGLPSGIELPDPGEVPEDMKKWLTATGVATFTSDYIIAVSAKGVCDTNASYNQNVVLQGYLNAMRYYKQNPDAYEEPKHPAQYYKLVNYALAYAMIDMCVKAGTPSIIPVPPVPNYQLVRKRTSTTA